MIEVSHNVVKIRNQETETFEAVPGLVLGYTGEAIEPVIRELSYLKDSDEIKQLIFNVIHPVGSIIHTTKEENPSTYLGGEWQRIEDRFLLGAGSTYAAGSTGGEAKHVLTINEMPSHNHKLRITNEKLASGSTYSRLNDNGDVQSSCITSTGGGAAHNNMPPYKTVYIWERTA